MTAWKCGLQTPAAEGFVKAQPSRVTSLCRPPTPHLRVSAHGQVTSDMLLRYVGC